MIRLIFSMFFLVVALVSCDKMDCNGKLDGNWQLTEWRDIVSGDVVADNTSGIFYTVKLELIQFKSNAAGYYPYLAYFDHKGDSLIIGDVFHNQANTDSLVTLGDLAQFGDDGSGRFLIRDLSSDRLVLTNRQNRLTFRKY